MIKNNNITLIAIETSCDDTGVAVVRTQPDNTIITLTNAIQSQADIHRKTGGIVPNTAGKEHTKALPVLIERVMKEVNITKDDIDAIAVTIGPGLMPSLLAGVHAAKNKAKEWNKPIVPIHHLEGHIYSALLQSTKKNIFPALALIVSGGNTMLIHVEKHLTYKVLGKTRDDAVGEAFDKVARMLNLEYPGGPNISRLAQKGNQEAFAFPIPMRGSNDLDFSYSGLKTAVKYTIEDLSKKEFEKAKPDIAASFQKTVIDSLLFKVKKALNTQPYNSLIIAGGVAANKELRKHIKKTAEQYQIPCLAAPLKLCGDNAVMIGQVGIYAYKAGRIKNEQDIDASARIEL